MTLTTPSCPANTAKTTSPAMPENQSRPERPFQEIAIDLCSHAGQTYLIIVDCYTDWPAVITLRPNTTTYTVISALRQSFCRTAIPDTIWSDGGPQFTSKAFSDFSTRWGFLHKFSSPRYPQSNGKVEATIKSMKKLIQHAWNGRALDDEKFCRSLLQYRNTPSRKDGLSPAQKLFGHPVQDILPAHRRSFLPQWQRPVHTSKSSAAYYNLHAHNLPDIHVGSHVAVQNPQSRLWDIYGIVTEIGPHRRYYIKTTGGRVLVRNRRFLRRLVPASVSKGLTPHTPNADPPETNVLPEG